MQTTVAIDRKMDNIKQNNFRKSNKREMKNAQTVESNVRSSETEYDVLKWPFPSGIKVNGPIHKTATPT